MYRDLRTRGTRWIFPIAWLCLILCPAALMAQGQVPDSKGQSPEARSKVTLTQPRPLTPPQIRQHHLPNSFCDEEPWDYYFDHYATASESS